MGTVASQITSLTIVYITVYSDADQSKHQSSASLAFVWRIHRGPVNSPHKWPVTRKMFPFDDVIMITSCLNSPPPPSAAYMRWWTGSSLVQVMARRQAITWTNADLLSIGHMEHSSVKLELKYTYPSWKCVWKYRLQNGGHFVQEEMSLLTSRWNWERWVFTFRWVTWAWYITMTS